MLVCCIFAFGSLAVAAEDRSIAISKDGGFHYERFGDDAKRPLLILLHGASGPAAAFYQQQAHFFADHGYAVWMPHYFDATPSGVPTTQNYQAWTDVVRALIKESRVIAGASGRSIFLLGYSLGASVALAAGSQGVAIDGIAEWYGSLPDDFFYRMKGMPPLLILHGQRDTNIPVFNAQQLTKLCDLRGLRCESHIYADQGHGFAGEALRDADQRTLTFLALFVPVEVKAGN